MRISTFYSRIIYTTTQRCISFHISTKQEASQKYTFILQKHTKTSMLGFNYQAFQKTKLHLSLNKRIYISRVVTCTMLVWSLQPFTWWQSLMSQWHSNRHLIHKMETDTLFHNFHQKILWDRLETQTKNISLFIATKDKKIIFNFWINCYL